jgi:hypothetical protein
LSTGGFDGVTRTNTVEKYSPSDRTWTPIPDMYNTRSNFGIEVGLMGDRQINRQREKEKEREILYSLRVSHLEVI